MFFVGLRAAHVGLTAEGCRGPPGSSALRFALVLAPPCQTEPSEGRGGRNFCRRSLSNSEFGNIDDFNSNNDNNHNNSSIPTVVIEKQCE